MPAGGRGAGRAWGGDLIVFVGPGVGHLNDLVLPGNVGRRKIQISPGDI